MLARARLVLLSEVVKNRQVYDGHQERDMQERPSRTELPGEEQKGIAIALVSVLLIVVISAMTYSRNLLWQDPIKLWENTVTKSPKKARVRYNLAKIYEARGYLDQAEKNYKTAIELKPDYVQAHNNLGNLHVTRGNFEDAIGEFQAALKLKPDAPLPHDNLGYIYFQQGRLNEAIREYRTALEIAPDSAEIHNNLGYAYFTQGRFDEAGEEFRTALKLKPDFPAARQNAELLAEAMSREHRREDR
jgi:Flp pilus assembly protein TadD